LEKGKTNMITATYDHPSNYHLWVIRDDQRKEPVMLVRSRRAVPSEAVLNAVYKALYPDRELLRRLVGSFDRDAGFNVHEWETWLAFGLAPAIEIYVENFSYYTDAKWEWKRVTE
jgi:hypothetical protein